MMMRLVGAMRACSILPRSPTVRRPDGSDNVNVIVVPCPECGAVSFWPPGGGADALLGQSLHVVVAMKQPAARGARAVQDVVAEVKARVVAMDGEARWVLDDTALQALEAPS